MSEETETGIKEVSIVKKFTTSDSENYVSVSLRSTKDTIGELLSKAVRATSTNSQTSPDKKLGIQ